MSGGARSASISAPAKLNLGLRITGRRPDGYHEIDSLFVPLDLCDEVLVELGGEAESGRTVSVDPVALRMTGVTSTGLPLDDRNLVVRAAHAFLAESQRSERVRIQLEKRIPSGAGLGGGSSDAAAALLALDRLMPGALPSAEIARIALGIGADVPFFLDPRPSRVRGVGEQIEAVGGLPGLPVLLVNPGISLATSEVYAAWDATGAALTPLGPRPTMPAVLGPGFLPSALAGPAADGLLANDLEAAAAQMCPAISGLQDQLAKRGAVATGMSGSGATVFGVFPTRSQAQSALEQGDFAVDGESEVWSRVAETGASS